jgi:hypothetical protein
MTIDFKEMKGRTEVEYEKKTIEDVQKIKR